jgi:hypothetical protein
MTLHQFRTRNNLIRTQRTRSKSNKNAAGLVTQASDSSEPTVTIAALLHEAIEDQNVKPETRLSANCCRDYHLWNLALAPFPLDHATWSNRRSYSQDARVFF